MRGIVDGTNLYIRVYETARPSHGFSPTLGNKYTYSNSEYFDAAWFCLGVFRVALQAVFTTTSMGVWGVGKVIPLRNPTPHYVISRRKRYSRAGTIS